MNEHPRRAIGAENPDVAPSSYTRPREQTVGHANGSPDVGGVEKPITVKAQAAGADGTLMSPARARSA
jgi:hypothetical protein